MAAWYRWQKFFQLVLGPQLWGIADTLPSETRGDCMAAREDGCMSVSLERDGIMPDWYPGHQEVSWHGIAHDTPALAAGLGSKL
ncbi:hypothetical protein N7467_001863 [Penicillium canescens]|nr:hypothetical protein N7467_001863 [Penicillium canescens]